MMCYNNTNSTNVDQYITTTDQFYNCSNSLVYERDDIILRSVYFTFKTASFNETEVNWEDFTETLIHGKCQTLRNLPELEEAYNFKAILNESIPAPYKIWLHDPDYFVTSLNPSGTPRLETTLTLHGTYYNSQLLICCKESRIILLKDKMLGVSSISEQRSIFS